MVIVANRFKQVLKIVSSLAVVMLFLSSEITAQNDSVVISLLLNEASELTNGESIKMAQNYCDSAILLATETKNPYLIAASFAQKGYCYKFQNNYDSSKSYLYKALFIFKQNEYSGQQAFVNTEMGDIHRITGQTDSALFYHRHALRLSLTENDSATEAKIYNNIGIVFKSRGIYDSAFYYFIKSEQLYRDLGMNSKSLLSLLNIANVYERQQNYDKAIQLYEQCYADGKKSNELELSFKAKTNMAVVYYYMGDNKESELAFLDAIDFNIQNNNEKTLSLLYGNLSLVYEMQGDMEKAIITSKKSLQLARKVNNSKIEIQALNNLGIFYKLQNEYGIAVKYYEESLAVASKAGNTDDQLRVLKNLSLLNEDIGDYKVALAYYTEYSSLKDSILNEKKIATIAELQMKYEKIEDETLILNLEKESAVQQAANSDLRRQRNIIIGSSATLAIILFMSLMLLRIRNRKNKEIAKQKIQLLEDEKKLLAAQSILTGQEEERKRISQELHDGIGVLLSTASIHFSNITGSSGDKELDGMLVKANDMIKQAGNEVRKISHNMMPGVLSNFGLFDALEDLFDEVDESGAIVVSYNMQGDDSRLNERTEIMVYRIMQELINNTLKHAKANNVRVDLQREISKLKISYVDDGVGFNYQSKQLDKSLGLSGISSRVDFLHGTLNVVTNRGKGCSYNIVVPL
ncbi:MAG: sensor histidine kinase [Bacteroidota bacterium]